MYSTSKSCTDRLLPPLLKAQAEMKNPELDCKVAYDRTEFRYASLGACLNAVKEPLNKNGLVLCQTFTNLEDGVRVTTTIIHAESGQTLAASIVIPVKVMTPQNLGSACTYGKRYTLCALCGIVGDDDEDGAQLLAPERVAEVCAMFATVDQTKGEKFWKSLPPEEKRDPVIAAAKEQFKARVTG